MTILLYSTTDYQYLGSKLCDRYGIQSGKIECTVFPDGEKYIRILDDENLDSKTWCRFPILSGGFENGLVEL